MDFPMNSAGLVSFCHSFRQLSSLFVTIAEIFRNYFVNHFLWIIGPVMHPAMHFSSLSAGKWPGNEPVDLQGVFHIVHRVIHSFAPFPAVGTFRIWR